MPSTSTPRTSPSPSKRFARCHHRAPGQRSEHPRDHPGFAGAVRRSWRPTSCRPTPLTDLDSIGGLTIVPAKRHIHVNGRLSRPKSVTDLFAVPKLDNTGALRIAAGQSEPVIGQVKKDRRMSRSDQHVPDILDCLAQLSNDEFPTSPKLASAMLDLLPEHVWHEPNYRWLNPFQQVGVFPCVRSPPRLLDGLGPGSPTSLLAEHYHFPPTCSTARRSPR